MNVACQWATQTATMLHFRLLSNPLHFSVTQLCMAYQAELGPQLGAEKLSAQLAIIGQPDIALLGVADDGHIASLFPDSPALSTSEAAVAVIDCVKAPRERVSCSLKYLTSATYRIAVQTGHNKRDIFVRLQQGERLPLALFSPTHWFMDYNATR
jgi:6-phosphogluconolactonase/glucosamine-6-phosphate isomerase/deaminase